MFEQWNYGLGLFAASLGILSFLLLDLPANVLLMQVGLGSESSPYFIGLKVITLLSLGIVFFGVVAIELDSFTLIECFPVLFAGIGAGAVFIFGYETLFQLFVQFSHYILNGGLVHIDFITPDVTTSWVANPPLRFFTTPLIIMAKANFAMLILSWFLTNKAVRSMKRNP